MLLLSLILAFLPSFIWLAIFLREDVHPEPNRLVIRAFLAGMLVTIPTIVLEGVLNCLFRECALPGSPPASPPFPSPFLALPEMLRTLLYLFVGIALVEELMKYAAIRMTALKTREFDEPIDALLYLVIAALGFAAVENAFTISNADVQGAGFFGPGGVLVILGARSLSATLLHALSSGTVGYFLARSFFSRRPGRGSLLFGLLVATLIHGAYNGFVGGLFVGGDATSPIANTALLLVVTGSVLLGMLRHLRILSERHRWQNEGDNAQQVDLVVRPTPTP